MNRTFRSLWNASLGTFVAAPETVSDPGRTGTSIGGARLLACRLTPLALALALAHGAHAGPSATQLPTGGVVQAGNAHVATSGNTLTVGQTSQRAVIQWDSFDVGRSAAVRFVQPDAGSVTLNRVVGNASSVIDGALKANGQVFLVNPNGVLFGRNAVVDVGGLVASTLDIPNADFMAGGSTFSLGARRGLVTNEGRIAAGEGGYIALIGQKVSNDGTLLARMGTVAMAAGDRVTLQLNGTSLVDVAIDRPTFDAVVVANRQLIMADGGLVKLTAGTADALLSTVVNNTGTIQSRTVENRAGRIFLLGQGGGVEVGGTLDASAPTHGDGGFVETSAAKVAVADGAAIDTSAADGRTGTWLVDPTDFTVAASGGDMTGATLTRLLATNNVTLQSSAGSAFGAGNVNVDDAVNWSAHTLTLEASNDINVNAVMTATGSAGLNLKAASNAVNFGLASNGFLGRLDFSGTGVLQMNVNGVLTPFTVIDSASGLQAVRNGLSGNYALGSSIDLSGIDWTPIGSTSSARFAGVFDGLGHTVDKMDITFAATANVLYRGLFGSTSGIVRNVGVTHGVINIDGGAYAVGYIGLLAGQSVGEMRNVYGDFNLDHRGHLKKETAQAILETARERDVVSLDTLERAMLVLNDTPGVHVTRVSVSPGARVGTSDFNVATEPTPEFVGAAVIDNYGSVYTGRNRLSLAGAWDGVSGNGDRLDIAALTTGHAGLASGRLGYGRLLTPSGLRGEFALSRTTYSLGNIYSSLDAVGHAESVSGQLTYPLVLTGTDRLTASWGGFHTGLVDEIRSTGVRLPKSVAAVTGGLEYAGIGPATATQAGALLTLGSLDIRDANARAADAAGADSHGTFSKLGLHAEHRRMLPLEIQLDMRLRAQATLSGKSLDGSQKMAVSGSDGVAAYAPGELLGDSGAVVRFALSRSFRLNDTVSIAPSIFVDEGRARNRYAMAGVARERSLGDAGLGIAARWRTATLSLQWIARTHGGDAVSEPVSKHRVLGQLSVGF